MADKFHHSTINTVLWSDELVAEIRSGWVGVIISLTITHQKHSNCYSLHFTECFIRKYVEKNISASVLADSTQEVMGNTRIVSSVVSPKRRHRSSIPLMWCHCVWADLGCQGLMAMSLGEEYGHVIGGGICKHPIQSSPQKGLHLQIKCPTHNVSYRQHIRVPTIQRVPIRNQTRFCWATLRVSDSLWVQTWFGWGGSVLGRKYFV